MPKLLPTAADAIMLPMNTACAVTGLSRAAIYRAAAVGHVTLRKNGYSTMVEMDILRAFVAALPVFVPRLTKQAA